MGLGLGLGLGHLLAAVVCRWCGEAPAEDGRGGSCAADADRPRPRPAVARFGGWHAPADDGRAGSCRCAPG